MQSVARTFLKECKIDVKEDVEVVKILAEHLKVFVFNVCALTNLIIMVSEENKLKPEHIPIIEEQMNRSCGIMRGGTSMASDFYGYNHPQYQAGSINDTSDMLKVDFAGGIARPEHSMSGGGACTVMQKSPSVEKFVNSRLKSAITKEMMPHFLKMLDRRMTQLCDSFPKNGKLTVKGLEKVFSMKKHFIFT